MTLLAITAASLNGVVVSNFDLSFSRSTGVVHSAVT